MKQRRAGVKQSDLATYRPNPWPAAQRLQKAAGPSAGRQQIALGAKEARIGPNCRNPRALTFESENGTAGSEPNSSALAITQERLQMPRIAHLGNFGQKTPGRQLGS